MVKIPQCQ